jgi:methylmalonyl-CoA mutase, N-terminal domain
MTPHPSGDGSWEELVYRRALAGKPARKAQFTTLSGIPIPPLHPESARRSAPPEPGLPGVYPFTRGVHGTMYRGRLWTMRQYAGFGSAEETNRRFRYLLEAGQSGLSVAFDLPTQIGYDPDHALSEGEVGKVGVSIATIHDMEKLFAELPLDRVSTSMTINSTAIVLLALYAAVARRRGVPIAKLSGTLQNDILKEYAARGTYRFPVEPSLRLVTDVIAFCAAEMPAWNPISISGYHIREAGSTAVQELAFTLSNGIAYVEATRARGLDVDRFAPRLSFFFNAHSDFFEEIAKFRAARRLWARIVRERFGAKDEESWRLRFHTQTAGSSLTSREPDVNVVRVALQALSAVLGGTQSLHTNSRDEALGLPTADAARLALRTQQVIAHESGVADVIDPLGGSPFVEWLTDELERGAAQEIAKIDAQGGAVAALRAGYYQREIHRSAYTYQKAVESGERVVVGVNRFADDSTAAAKPEVFRVDPEARRARAREVDAVRRSRDAASAERSLERLRSAAATTDNLVPHVLECVEREVTVGEICAALEDVFGAYREPAVF